MENEPQIESADTQFLKSVFASVKAGVFNDILKKDFTVTAKGFQLYAQIRKLDDKDSIGIIISSLPANQEASGDFERSVTRSFPNLAEEGRAIYFKIIVVHSSGQVTGEMVSDIKTADPALLGMPDEEMAAETLRQIIGTGSEGAS